MIKTYYKCSVDGPAGQVWDWELVQWVDESTLNIVTDPEVDGDTVYDAQTIAELVVILKFYGYQLGILMSPEQAYLKARAAVTNQYEPLLTAKKDTRVAMVMRGVRNDVALEELGNKYYETAREMKAHFQQVDADLGIVIGEASIPQPTPQAACFFCAEPMRLISIFGMDYWECPVCGRRVPVGEALSFVINTDPAVEFNAAVKKHLDDFAKLKGYDNIDMGMAMYNSAAFAADGQAAVSAYDATWNYIISNGLSDQVAAGTLSVADAIAQLPALSWDGAA